ncbi:hypothetical protein [Streptomyces wuyuanensis]|uniref:hypothetical protein n=1 Tax=Streptomyces wuyuanensis TaxID=1196353 RepID=UPI00370F8FCC
MIRARRSRATAPGEIVVNWSVQGSPGPELLGTRLQNPGGPRLTVVGFAAGMSKSAGAWVSPEQMAAPHPSSAQMLYRFTDSSSEAQLSAGPAEATAGLPKASLTGAQTFGGDDPPHQDRPGHRGAVPLALVLRPAPSATSHRPSSNSN